MHILTVFFSPEGQSIFTFRTFGFDFLEDLTPLNPMLPRLATFEVCLWRPDFTIFLLL
jgi:hypothetical protein